MSAFSLHERHLPPQDRPVAAHRPAIAAWASTPALQLHDLTGRCHPASSPGPASGGRAGGTSASRPMSRPGGPRIVRGMEIRISLDRVEPPAGRLGQAPSPPSPAGEEIPVTGWLGLLRALYLVVGQLGDQPGG